jgi:hypothetical protein
MKQTMINTMQRPKFDSLYTPYYALEPLLEYADIKPGSTIWEPTDIPNNAIREYLEPMGFKVIGTTFDFLTTPPGILYDYIITNPPYSLKDEFLKRAYDLGTPFAFLLPLTALEGVRRGKLWRKMGKDFGVIVLDRRVEFQKKGGVWFNTSWFCYRMLPEQLMFAELIKE